MDASDLDVLRSANLLIQKEGDAAWEKAAAKSPAFEAAQGYVAAVLWRRIAAAIAELKTTAPGKLPLN